ncbi:COR domain-containing protein [Micromonospora chersina]|uniref:COR domain-containing protein n=1 Tax=Micromonospora chersina TaxID=47854 RepID=UPI003716BE53
MRTEDLVAQVERDDSSDEEDFDFADGGWTEDQVFHEIALARTTGILDLSFAGLADLPDEVFNIKRLRVLRLTGNGLDSLSPNIQQLEELEVLDVWDNPECDIPTQIGELTKLEVLSVGPRCQLPSSIGRSRKIRQLAIGGNNLGRVPDWLFELEELEVAQLWGNQFTELPDRWDRIAKLNELNLAKNALTEVPESFGALRRLRLLGLEDNKISQLPESMVGLPIVNVRLGFNRFTSVPPVVSSWKDLKILDFFSEPGYGIYATAADDDGPDTDIEVADISASHLRKNSISTLPRHQVSSSLEDLPRSLQELPSLEVLLLHGNPSLQLPEELLGNFTRAGWDGSAKAILEYYFRTKEAGRPLNEAKLILLGWGGVGKTSLVNRLVHDRFQADEARTEGIQVTNWDVTLPDQQSARLNVWDFGGQEIMHATHQFFLTSRSLYLLVLSGRSGSADADAEYWLRLMESFAPGSPVIVVLNQIQRDPFELDEVGLRRRFPDIRGFVRTDCAAGQRGVGIEDLRARVVHETSNLPDLKVKFPAAWFEIKNRLSDMQENYLSFESYRALCRTLGEVNLAEQEKLAQYLHLLGIALNYRDDPRLRDTHVLNPHWVTEGIYAILNSSLLAAKKGEVEAADLLRILDSDLYPPERHAFLLDLMRKFELCFPYHDHPNKFLIAELLPKQQPTDIGDFIDESPALRFQYRYPVLPEGLLPRFIVRSHALSTDQPRWRSGCVLSWEGNRALVQAEATDRAVHISVDGPADGRRRLLAVIRSDFEHIHQSFRFKVDAYVPYGVRGRRLMVEYAKLVAAELNNMPHVQEFMDGEFYNIPVIELLNGVDLAPRTRTPRGKGLAKLAGKKARIFISYSHKDEKHKEALENHLKVLQRSGLIEVWSDRRIGAGDGWRGLIDRNLQEAEIVILLVSSDFLGSDYCSDVEMAEALRRHEAGECRVIPVIVRPCNWLHDSALKELQALPTDGKAVTEWENADTAWRIVSQGIEAAVRQR